MAKLMNLGTLLDPVYQSVAIGELKSGSAVISENAWNALSTKKQEQCKAIFKANSILEDKVIVEGVSVERGQSKERAVSTAKTGMTAEQVAKRYDDAEKAVTALDEAINAPIVFYVRTLNKK